MMALIKLGSLENAAKLPLPPVVQKRTLFPPTAASDTFEFTTTGGNINLSITGNSSSGDVDLSLFHDTNGDGVLNVNQGDTFLQNSNRNFSTDEAININGLSIRGTFFAVVNHDPGGSFPGVGPIPTSYTFTASRAFTSDLLPHENTVGTITQDLTRTGTVKNSNTADVYSFSVKRTDQVIVRLSSEIGGNAGIRLIEDRNNNRIIDSGDRFRGSLNSNVLPTPRSGIDRNFLLQVNQVSGETQYQVTFNHRPFPSST
jgi:hypothetical protein